VIAEGGGSLTICGETINNTLTDNASSAIEALCVNPRGQQTLQLARQLTATALNCIVSGGDADCTGVSIDAVFDACNAACAAGGTGDSCIQKLDCFNNGGVIITGGFCQTGTCSDNQFPCNGGDRSECGNPATAECVPLPGNCHSQDLPLDDLNLPNNTTTGPCNGKQGPAGSSDECKTAHKTPCAVLQPREGQCAVQ
jgi:hypothetical protein